MTTMIDDVEIPDFDQARFDGGRFDGILRIMGPEGDVPLMWDKSNPVEVDIAKRAFDRAIKKGMLAYRVEGKEGEQGEQMREFDPEAERMILSPPLAGG